MLRENGFIVVGFAQSLAEVKEIEGIVKLAKLGIRIQDLNKEE